MLYNGYNQVYNGLKQDGGREMTDVRERLRDRIEYTIDHSGLTAKEVADKLGVSRVAVYNWLKGKNTPDFDTLVKFCELFSVTLNFIYGLDPINSDKRDLNRELLLQRYDQLNLTGQIKLADFADDLFRSGKYTPISID